VQASVARRLRAPPEAAKPQEFSFGLLAALRSKGHRSTVVVGNCTLWTDNGGTSPSESIHLYTSVDPISAPLPANVGYLVEPPGTAPGSDPLITCAFIAVVPEGTEHI